MVNKSINEYIIYLRNEKVNLAQIYSQISEQEADTLSCLYPMTWVQDPVISSSLSFNHITLCDSPKVKGHHGADIQG